MICPACKLTKEISDFTHCEGVCEDCFDEAQYRGIKNIWTVPMCVKTILEWEQNNFLYYREELLKVYSDCLSVYETVGGNKLIDVDFGYMFRFVMKWYKNQK